MSNTINSITDAEIDQSTPTALAYTTYWIHCRKTIVIKKRLFLDDIVEKKDVVKPITKEQYALLDNFNIGDYQGWDLRIFKATPNLVKFIDELLED